MMRTYKHCWRLVKQAGEHGQTSEASCAAQQHRLLALGRHVRGCQATTEVLDMQLQHTLMRPLLRLRMLARTVHHEIPKAGQT
jgi:hypothetical protein